MKNFCIYISILVIAISSLSAVKIAAAADPLGWCTIITDNAIGSDDIDRTRTTENTCKLKEGYTTESWKRNVATGTTFGTCVVKNPQKQVLRTIQNLTQSECSSKRPSGQRDYNSWTLTWTEPPPQQGPDEPVDESLGTCRFYDPNASQPTLTLERTKETPCINKPTYHSWHPSTEDEYKAGVLASNCKAPKVIRGGKCIDLDPNYYLLSPLPCPPNAENCDGQLLKYDTTVDDNLSHYLNMMIIIFIGACGVIAVVVIVVGGLEYMTSELPGNKEHGKERIVHAFLGLALACGAWIILHEINPDLLQVDLPKGIVVEVQLEEEGETPAMALTSSDTFDGTQAATPACPETIVIFSTSGGNFTMCRSISAKVKAMVDRAWAEGIKLSGGGYRSARRQRELRAQNCGGQANIYNKKAKCIPLTAYPGKSRHENGLAIDLSCEGHLIRAQDNKCFVWLKNNAAAYGLRNLPAEPWHWSIDGK